MLLSLFQLFTLGLLTIEHEIRVFPEQCNIPAKGCVMVVAEKFDLFGISCSLPDSCGPLLNKTILSGNWVKRFYLCSRYHKNVHTHYHHYKFVVDKGVVAISSPPVDFVDSVMAFETHSGLEFYSPLYLEHCMKEFIPCVNVTDGETLFSHTSLQESQYKLGTFRDIDSFLARSPLSVTYRVEKQDKTKTFNFPCLSRQGRLALTYAYDPSDLAFEFRLWWYYENLSSPDDRMTMDCNHTQCTIYRDTPKGVHPAETFPIEPPLRIYFFWKKWNLRMRIGDFVHHYNFTSSPTVIISPPHVINPEHLICSKFGIDKVTADFIQVYNDTHHYSYDGVLRPNYRSRHCIDGIPVLHDVFDLLILLRIVLYFISVMIKLIFEIAIEIMQTFLISFDDLFTHLLVMLSKFFTSLTNLIFTTLFQFDYVPTYAMISVITYIRYQNLVLTFFSVLVVHFVCMVFEV